MPLPAPRAYRNGLTAPAAIKGNPGNARCTHKVKSYRRGQHQSAERRTRERARLGPRQEAMESHTGTRRPPGGRQRALWGQGGVRPHCEGQAMTGHAVRAGRGWTMLLGDASCFRSILTHFACTRMNVHVCDVCVHAHACICLSLCAICILFYLMCIIVCICSICAWMHTCSCAFMHVCSM